MNDTLVIVPIETCILVISKRTKRLPDGHWPYRVMALIESDSEVVETMVSVPYEINVRLGVRSYAIKERGEWMVLGRVDRPC